jgi:CheY-like chemotaxis protein
MEKNKKRKILLVDDDTFLLEMYSLRFSQAGFIVETATTSDQVFEKVKSGYIPDVLILDVVMPTNDGFELIDKINKENLLPKALKVFLSNLGQEQDLAKGKALGSDGYIIKANNTPSEVLEYIIKLLEKHGL